MSDPSARSATSPRTPQPARPARLLSGWGGTAPTAATVLAIAERNAVEQAMGRGGDPAERVPSGGTESARLASVGNAPRGVIARGLGRSYGDAAVNAGGVVVDAVAGAGGFRFDSAAGTVTAEAGASLHDILSVTVPAGWFVPVSPGTRYVTVGGAVAADIHGKNHHADGTFGEHVRRLLLHLPGGERRTVSPTDDPEAFWATVGGMGLTGIVEEATFDLMAIPSSRLLVDTTRTRDLDHTMAAMADDDHRHRFTVAWIDLAATGRSLGRGVLTSGSFAPLDALSPADRRAPHRYRATQRLAAPPWAPSHLLNPLSVRAFNELWFRKAPTRREGELQSIAAFFHVLDGVRGWNRLYGRRGFVQHQTVVPYGHEDVLRAIVERLASAGVASFLAVLKRFGAAGSAPLSFPLPGWTLALDLPAGQHGLAELLDAIDDEVVAVGGRVYLAKDARLRPSLLPAMYPRLAEWRAVRARLDPSGVMQSDLDRRLDLTGRLAGVGVAPAEQRTSRP